MEDKKSFMRTKIFKTVFVTAILAICMSTTSLASYRNIGQFPIGIFNSPSYQNTTYESYNLIKNMNATYVSLVNGIDNYQMNDAAIVQAQANGLKVFVNDIRIEWTTSKVSQTIINDGKYLSSSNPLGQTFKIPVGGNYYLSSFTPYIDPANWTADVTLTLTIYDSPSKTSVIATSSLSGPIPNYNAVFPLSAAVTAGSTLYWELTSDSTTPIGWVCISNTNPYTDGMAYENGISAPNNDFWFELQLTHPMYLNDTKPSNAVVDEIADHYKSNTAVAGYGIKDEPGADSLSSIFDVVERFRLKASHQMTYVNLLPDYAGDDGINGPYGFGNSQVGNYLISLSNIGQTFITNGVTSYISTIQFYLDSSTWRFTEGITLKLWDSPLKNVLIAQVKKYGGVTNDYPQFTLNATVTPYTSYYLELTHDGGWNNIVSDFVRSSPGIDWERGGSAYVNNVQIPNSDFWITINQNIIARSYEDYVYRWAKLRPDFLMYDYYPFAINDGFHASYYSNLEVIRKQSLTAGIPFWSYIQSCGIDNSLRVPNANEIRYQVYTNLTYGCKGINYFLYQTPDISTGIHDGIILPDGTVNTSLYNAIKDVNAQVLKIGPTLIGLTSQAVYHSGELATGTIELPGNFFFQPTQTSEPVITGYFKNSSGRKYIMVTNRDYINSRSITFILNPKPTSVKEISKITGKEVYTNYSRITGKLSSTFAPGEGKLYVMPIGY